MAIEKFVSQGLAAEQHTVNVYSDREQARTAIGDVGYDLIILIYPPVNGVVNSGRGIAPLL